MKILMVISSQTTLGDSDTPTGAWLEELAASYWVFRDAGCEIVLASPLGGAAPIDPMSQEAPWLTNAGARFQQDPDALRALASTIPLTDVTAYGIASVYLVGGVATAWDFPGNPQLSRLVSELFQRGQPVAGVCHGVLGLCDAVDTDGNNIIAGRDVTGVSNAEEILTGFDKIVPCTPEDRLRELGGNYQCAEPFEEYVISDENLFTGQNPASAGPLAVEILKALGA